MYLIHAQVFFCEDILDPKWIFFIHYDPRLRNVFEDASINIDKTNYDQPNTVQGEKIVIHDDVQVEEVLVEEYEDDNDDNFPLAIWRSRIRGAYSAYDIMEEYNMDDIKRNDENRSGDIHVTDLEINFIDTEYNECEDEDNYNTTLVGWCSKNNIRYLKEHMNIHKETLEDINTYYNINEDF